MGSHYEVRNRAHLLTPRKKHSEYGGLQFLVTCWTKGSRVTGTQSENRYVSYAGPLALILGA